MTNHDAFLDRTLHAVADSTRLRILQALKQREKSHASRTSHPPKTNLKECSGLCAGDIEECVKVSQPTISHHMAILTKAGLIDVVKQGQWRWYRRNENALRKMIKQLRAKI